MRQSLYVVALAATVALCPAFAADDESQTTIAEARALLDQADAAGYEWRDSDTILKLAEEAAAHGDQDRATQLAEVAKFQGEAALAQARREANAGPRF
jgi:hypothetical protein